MTNPRVTVKEIIKGKKYELTFRIDGKRIRRQKFRCSKKEVEKIAAHYTNEMMNKNYEFLDNKKIISLDELIMEFFSIKNSQVRKSTLKRYKNYLSPFKKFILTNFSNAYNDISQIKPVYINEAFTYFIEKLNWQPKTLNGARACINSIFLHAIEEKYIDENPTKKLQKFKVPEKEKIKFYTDEQLKLIWKNVKPFWLNHFKFLYLTGLRKGELINLIWENVNINPNMNSHIVVAGNGDWDTKTGKSRVVPLNKEAVKIIEEQRGKNENYVFTSPEGKKVHPDKIYKALKTVVNKIGIDGTVHMFRHTFGAKLTMAGVSLYTVGKLMGHSNIETTQIYAHLSPGHLQSAVDKL